jgi:ADP-heptose:LPS heptosyltransferase
MKILISPYSRLLLSGKINAKNYPYWPEVIKILIDKGHIITQIGLDKEVKLVEDFRVNLSLAEVSKLVIDYDLWIAVDNFLAHLAHTLKKPGIVIFSLSDPKIFGYPENVNIIKDKSFLRANQFDLWENATYETKAFIEPDKVITMVDNWGNL